MSADHLPADLAAVVARGLGGPQKSLPPFLFYDARGSELFERITELPEYYLTRAERSIFERQGANIVADAARLAGEDVDVLELGAGSSTKTQVLLRALTRRQRRCRFFAGDVSRTALDEGAARLGRELADVDVEPLCGSHESALARVVERGGRRELFVLFIGSSIGNYDDDDAVRLLRAVRAALGPRGVLLLGTDLRKSPETLVRAYDDAAGVTAAFNKNVLARLNRELDADFDLATFRHVALWNERASRIEMHLESTRAQDVHVRALDLRVAFAAGERIHTESSHKYDEPRVEALLRAAGLSRAITYHDPKKLFAVHLARRS